MGPGMDPKEGVAPPKLMGWLIGRLFNAAPPLLGCHLGRGLLFRPQVYIPTARVPRAVLAGAAGGAERGLFAAPRHLATPAFYIHHALLGVPGAAARARTRKPKTGLLVAQIGRG